MTATADTDGESGRIVAEIEKAFRASNRSRAFELANAAILAGDSHPALFGARAIRYEELYRFEDALSDYMHLLAVSPNDPRLLVSIGQCRMRLDHWREALGKFDAAIAAAPNFPMAHYRRGQALARLERFPEARAAFERAVVLKPDMPGPLGSLALMAVREGNPPRVKSYAQRALAADPRQATALVALAMLDLASNDISALEAKLRKVLDDPRFGDDPRANMVIGILADALDKKGRIDFAFSVQVALNAKRREFYAARFEKMRAADKAARLIAYFERSPAWQKVCDVSIHPKAAVTHVFLVGPMRSGTSLLEAVLASSPEIAALDECDSLYEATHAFLDSDADLRGLDNLHGEELTRWRDAYWDAVIRHGADVAGKVFVDKMPIHLLNLPLIAKLFPDAKILLALRDPRDVVLSCFRHRFEMSPDTFEFLLLDDCARHYTAIMRAAMLYREKLPLDIHLHRYEDMIEDFDSSILAVCDFIGVRWNESMRDFSRGAAVINEKSASAEQVRRGLYKGATGQWRRYRKQLAPVLPILEPWVEHFGYGAA